MGVMAQNKVARFYCLLCTPQQTVKAHYYNAQVLSSPGAHPQIYERLTYTATATRDNVF